MAGSLAGAAAPRDDVTFATRAQDGGYVVTGTNASPVLPWHALIAFPVLENLRASVPLPARVVLPPASTRDLITLARISDRAGTRVNVSYRYGKGDPAAVPDPAARYLFPWEHGTKHAVDQGYFGATTHRGMAALDFNMPEGTRICAAREGVVIATRGDSNRGGPGAAYEGWANYVDILHADGTWANYAHLKLHGDLVRPGDRVAAGQVIGLSGKTGRASGPHLHFAVYRASWEAEGGEAIPTLFTHLDPEPVSPVEGKTYYAVHPGGPAFTPALGERLRDADLEAVVRPVPATRAIRVRSEQVDAKTLLWCANGTAQAQDVTVSFTRIAGLAPSRPVPYTRRVPARSEVFLFSLDRIAGARAATFEVSWSWKRARATAPDARAPRSAL